MTATPTPEQLAALMVLAASASPEAVAEADGCPRCGGSVEIDPVSDYGEVTRVHRGLVACRQDGHDDNCDWASTDAELVAAHEDEESRLAAGLPDERFRNLQRWSFLSPPLGGVKAVRYRHGRWVKDDEAGEVIKAITKEAAALREALRVLCLQREGHFHTEAAWAKARALAGLESRDRSW